MANIRFPLEMKDGVKVRELEEFQENFDLEKAIEYFANGKLQKWLESTYNDDILEEIESLSEDDEDFVSKFTEALGVEGDCTHGRIDLQKNLRESHIKERLKGLLPTEKVEQVLAYTVESQDMLEQYVQEGKKKVYLLDGEYYIPNWISDVKLEGIGEVIVRIEAQNKEEFIKQRICMINVKPADDQTEKKMVIETLDSTLLELLDILKRMIEKEVK